MKKKALSAYMRGLAKRSVAARQAAKAKQLVPRAAWPLPAGQLPTTVSDWQLLGAHAAEALWTGALPHQVAKELSSLCRAQLAAFKVGSLADQLKELQESFSTIEARGSAKQQARIMQL